MSSVGGSTSNIKGSDNDCMNVFNAMAPYPDERRVGVMAKCSIYTKVSNSQLVSRPKSAPFSSDLGFAFFVRWLRSAHFLILEV